MLIFCLDALDLNDFQIAGYSNLRFATVPKLRNRDVQLKSLFGVDIIENPRRDRCAERAGDNIEELWDRFHVSKCTK